MFNPIYTPRGRAREYSPLALNIYNGCDHNCSYCYVKGIPGQRYDGVNPRKGLLDALSKQLRKHDITEQVLLCFTGDPYCHKDVEVGLTRDVLELLLAYQVPVAILTKGGARCLRDIDLFKKFDNIKVGATLTFIDVLDSATWELGAGSPAGRMKGLAELYVKGIKTWVSLEPVIDPAVSIRIIDLTHSFVDQYKVGKLNHYKELEAKIDWTVFATAAVEKLRGYGKQFYVKKDLAKFLPDGYLTAEENDSDKLALTKSREGVLL